MRYESIELLCRVILNELDYVIAYLLNSSNLVIRLRLSLLTLKESRYRSGFSLNNLHNFFVLSFNIMDRFAIST